MPEWIYTNILENVLENSVFCVEKLRKLNQLDLSIVENTVDLGLSEYFLRILVLLILDVRQ